ncbi:MAG: ribonuclease P protein component [Bacteroidales bacterium]
MPDKNKGNTSKENDFPKSGRLYLKDETEDLFRNGKKFYVKPLKIQYTFVLADIAESRSAIMISVPKKYHHSAVKRNHIKRLIREAWRTHNAELEAKLVRQKKKLNLAVIYLSGDIPDYSEIESKIILTLQRLTDLLSNEQSL